MPRTVWPESGAAIPGMSIDDFPADARIFKSKAKGGFISAILIVVSPNRAWEYRKQIDPQKVPMWQTWAGWAGDGSTAYAEMRGIEISRYEARAIETFHQDQLTLPEWM